jgi:hypothetical protein
MHTVYSWFELGKSLKELKEHTTGGHRPEINAEYSISLSLFKTLKFC